MSRRVVTVVYGFTTPLRREEMMIEILNFTSLIVNLSWQIRVALDDRVAWSNLVVHVFLYVLEAK